jgi:peptide/nickel transport system substrate-binding protein
MALVADALESAGFTVTPVPVPSGSRWGNYTYNPQAPLDIRGGTWCSDYASGSNWIPALFGSDGDANSSFLRSDAVDAEIARVAALPLGQQAAAWGELDKTVMTDYYPAVVTEYDVVAMLHGRRIGGMNVDNTLGTPTFKDIYVIPKG